MTAHEKLIKWRRSIASNVPDLDHEYGYAWSEPLTDPGVFRDWADQVREYVLRHSLPTPPPHNKVVPGTSTGGIMVLCFSESRARAVARRPIMLG